MKRISWEYIQHVNKGNNKITEPILFLYLNTVTVTAGTFEP
jgi:hypothetical protein